MKKCLLITWLKNYNYGTALQAYSLKNILEDITICDIESKNVKNEKMKCDIINFKAKYHINLRRKLKKMLDINAYKVKMNQVQDNIAYKKIEDTYKIRTDACDKFFEKNFSMTELITDNKMFNSFGKKYDIYVAGSDQIWNPDNYEKRYFLGWVDDSKKIISYASSLSTSVIPKNMIKKYERNLSRFDAISIRDVACRKQLEEIVGKKVSTVVDPVILFGRNNLENVTKNINIVKKDYAFAYFLGSNISYREYFLEYIKKSKLDGVALTCVSKEGIISDGIIKDYAVWDVDPLKFVKYIKEAKFVITDSFHATVLAILFHVNFVVMEKDKNRPQQNNRIKEILGAVGLENRWNDSSKMNLPISDEEWRKVDENIAELRKKSYEYLIGALYE